MALIPLANRSCHAVVALGAWRHFADPQKVATEVVRVLANDGIFIVGYFPPALGGVIHLGQGVWRRLLDRFYQFLIRKLGYTDRTDLALEQQAITILRDYFAEINTVVSGKNWHLIVGHGPVIN